MKRENIINLSLTTPGSLTKAIERLENYEDEIVRKTEVFIEKLMELGIKTAKSNSGKYRNYLHFEQKLYTYGKYDTIGLLIASDSQKIISEWIRNGQVVSAEVSPLLMAEFGSGWLSQVYFPAVKGIVGQGTFPGGRHAFDENGWYWKEPGSDMIHHSYGEKPTHPMYAAIMAMVININKVAYEVFN